MPVLKQPEWPSWWAWKIELSSHLLKRMIERRFTEADLLSMLEGVERFRADSEPGRWIVETRLRGRPWRVIVEPDRILHVLVVITAFRVS